MCWAVHVHVLYIIIKCMPLSLSGCHTDWSVQGLSFSEFKTCGELLLKGNKTSEIVATYMAE